MASQKATLESSIKVAILLLFIALTSTLIFSLFVRDIPSLLANGNRGGIAIKILDEVRRPFLDIHRAESSLLSDGYSKTIQERFERGVDNSLHLIADFKTAADYNPKLLECVEILANAFEEWSEIERTLFGTLARKGSTNSDLMSREEIDHIIAMTSEYFDRVMDLLGDAEIPIHDDIDEGARAVTEILIAGGILLASLIGMVIFLQWFKYKKLREMSINNKQTEERLRMAMFAGEMGTWKWDTVINQDTRDANFNRILGLEAAESTQPKEDFVERIHPEDRAAVDQEIKRSIRERDSYLAEFRIVHPDGIEKWLRDQGLPFYDKQDKISYMTGAVVDITKRKQAEEQIKASLEEKEILLKEIYHRVKNNLQVISSLFNLQTSTIKDKHTLELFRESQDRIKTMVLIHEKLYQSKDITRIDYADYIQSLATYLLSSYGVSLAAVGLKVNVDNVTMDIDTAIPCGLIMNELISNSLKYAFPDGKRGEIGIELYPCDDEKYMFTVSDNGVGIPKGLDIRKTETLGFQLVTKLTKQLHGEIALDRRNGTAFKLTFPKPSFILKRE